MDSKKGVFYSSKDYAGILRRLLILGIDFVVLALLALGILILPISPESATTFNIKLLTILLVSYCYLTILKRSERGTLGYLLTGVRIVDLEGKKPSLLTMTFRYLLVVFGPFNFILDIFWLGDDVNKQALRDKLVGTYVVNRKALPVGAGVQRYVHYSLMMYSLLFREVSRPGTK